MKKVIWVHRIPSVDVRCKNEHMLGIVLPRRVIFGRKKEVNELHASTHAKSMQTETDCDDFVDFKSRLFSRPVFETV